jgi:competence protein ComEC
MFEESKPEQQASGLHLLVLLLPFTVGLYLADFRQNTDSLLKIIEVFSAVILMLWLLFLRLKKRALMHRILSVASLFLLGYWHMYLTQHNWRQSKEIKIQTPEFARLKIAEIDLKTNGQLLIGNLQYRKSQRLEEIPIQVYTNYRLPLQLSDELWVKISPEPILNDRFPGAFDLERFLQFKGVTHQAYLDSTQIWSVQKKPASSSFSALLKKQRKTLSELFDKYLDGEAADIAVALIVGDRSGVDEKSRQAFQGTGSMHIMAVSGMHIALLLTVLFKFSAYFGSWISRKTAIFLLLLLIWYYALLTGLSAAVLRSVVMFTFLLIGQLAGRQVSSLMLLYFSAFLLLIFNPLFLFDLGFQLSYMAMWGIFLLYPKINSWFVFRWPYLQTLWEGTALGIAATLSTAPLTLYYFHTFPNYFALANLFLMTLSSFILIVGMLFPLFTTLPFVNQLMGYVFEKSIDLLLWIMDFFAQLPGALVSGFTFHFFWVLATWLALFIWSQEKFMFWRKYTYIFGVVMLAELSLQRVLQFHSNAILWIPKSKVMVVKQRGQLHFIALKQKKQNRFLIQGLEAYYGLHAHSIKPEKQNFYWRSGNVDLKVSTVKNQKIKLKANAQGQAIQIY